MPRLALLVSLLFACSPAKITGNSDAGPVVPVELQGLVPEACAGSPAFEPGGFVHTYELPASSAFTRRSFPLLAILGGDAATRAAIDSDSVLGPMAVATRASLEQARSCAGDAACIRGKLSSYDSTAVADALSARFSALSDAHLRPSGAFMRWASSDAPTLVREAWAFTHAGLLATFDEAASELTAAQLDTVVAAGTPWFEPLRAVTEAALVAAGRNEAFRYEPIDSGENAAALEHLKTLDLNSYPFSMLMLPGQGPDDPVTQISGLSMSRADLAAARWKAGLVPVIVASGGHVHPDRTPYSEAVEMKHYLMSMHGLPESAILLDPYARHTTTNVRNAGRLQLQLGMSPEKPMLFTSDAFQAPYIGILLGPRCVEELGYQPWRTIAMYETGTDGCLTVARDLLFVDASDPLDP